MRYVHEFVWLQLWVHPASALTQSHRRLGSELMKEQDQEHDQAKDAKESFSTVPTAEHDDDDAATSAEDSGTGSDVAFNRCDAKKGEEVEADGNTKRKLEQQPKQQQKRRRPSSLHVRQSSSATNKKKRLNRADSAAMSAAAAEVPATAALHSSED